MSCHLHHWYSRFLSKSASKWNNIQHNIQSSYGHTYLIDKKYSPDWIYQSKHVIVTYFSKTWVNFKWNRINPLLQLVLRCPHAPSHTWIVPLVVYTAVTNSCIPLCGLKYTYNKHSFFQKWAVGILTFSVFQKSFASERYPLLDCKNGQAWKHPESKNTIPWM